MTKKTAIKRPPKWRIEICIKYSLFYYFRLSPKEFEKKIKTNFRENNEYKYIFSHLNKEVYSIPNKKLALWIYENCNSINLYTVFKSIKKTGYEFSKIIKSKK